jgi:YggT family protein
MRPLLDVILLVLDLYMDVIIGVAILSWLVAFNVVNLHNDVVRSIWNALNGLTEPVLRPIRKALPNMGTLDISPIVVMLAIFLIKREIQTYIYPYAF